MLVDVFDPCESASGGSQTVFLALSISVLVFIGIDAFATAASVVLYTHSVQTKKAYI